MTAHSVLIVDDDPGLRAAWRLLIGGARDLAVAGEASDGAAAVDLAGRLAPDLVLMDVQMPRMNGVEATRAICARPRPPRVLMLTMFDLDEYVYAALRAGASGFLLKNSPPAVVLGALRAVHDGSALLDAGVTTRLVARLAPSPQAHSDDRLGGLTRRERETLSLIGRGLSNDDLADALFITPTTARTYVSRLLHKLDARDRAQLVVIAYESGLISPR